MGSQNARRSSIHASMPIIIIYNCELKIGNVQTFVTNTRCDLYHIDVRLNLVKLMFDFQQCLKQLATMQFLEENMSIPPYGSFSENSYTEIIFLCSDIIQPIVIIFNFFPVFWSSKINKTTHANSLAYV